jgi:hypothetical protein
MVLNVHVSCKDNRDGVKDSFYEEIGRVFDQFLKYYMKTFCCDFKVKVSRKDVFKPTIWNESLHEISNDNAVRAVNFVTPKNLVVKSTMFPHRSVQKHTWTSPNG